VTAQLKLDLRHPKTGAAQTSRMMLTMLTYGFSSAVLALSLAERSATVPEFLFVGMSFGAVLAAFGVAGSYDDLMGRPRDHARSLTYPLAEGTLYAARLTNVTIFCAVMTVSAVVPVAFTAYFVHDLTAAAVIGGALAAMMLGVTFAILAGVWFMTLVTPLRMQRVILSIVRAFLIGGLVLGYQWVATQSTLIVEAAWWPAYWFVLAIEAGSMSGWLPIGVFTAILVGTYSFYFPRRYGRILQRSADSEALRRTGRSGSLAPASWERWAVRSSSARAAFGLTAAALQSDRLVRGRVWPAALLAFVFAAFGWWAGGLGDLFVYGAQHVLVEPAIHMHLSVVTILLFAAQAAMQGVQVSDQPEAAWAFDVLPVSNDRLLQIGAQQALLFRVLIPLHVVLGLLLALSMPVLHAALHAAFWLAGCALITRLQAVFRKAPPFTRRSDRFSAGERFLPLVMAIPMALFLLVLQGVTFVEPLSATLLVVGLFIAHSALGHLPHGSVLSKPETSVRGLETAPGG